MTSETRAYLTEVVRVFDMRLKRRGTTRAAGRFRNWEKKIYDGAKKLLGEEQLDLMNPPSAPTP